MLNDQVELRIVRRYEPIEQGGNVYRTAMLPSGDTIPLSWPNSIAAFQGIHRFWKSLNCSADIHVTF